MKSGLLGKEPNLCNRNTKIIQYCFSVVPFSECILVTRYCRTIGSARAVNGMCDRLVLVFATAIAASLVSGSAAKLARKLFSACINRVGNLG